MPRHLAVVINSLANPKWQSQPLVSPSPPLLPSRARPLPRSYQHDRRRSIGCQRGAIHCCPWTNSAAVAAATWVSPSGSAAESSAGQSSKAPFCCRTRSRAANRSFVAQKQRGRRRCQHKLPFRPSLDSGSRSLMESPMEWNGLERAASLHSRDPPYDWRHFLLCRT